MKKIKFLFQIAILIAILSPVTASAQDQTPDTLRRGWTISSATYAKYSPKDSVSTQIVYRYNEANQLALVFSITLAGVVDVQLFDYDKSGNLLERNTLSLMRSKENPNWYSCKGCYFSPKKLEEIREKTENRLDNKK